MRQQYHFRKSIEGLLAWDIGRLIALSKDFPITQIPITDIKELDEPYWFDLEGSTPTCKNIAEHARLMQQVDMRYPIILFADGSVADGMHRACRAWIEGAQSIKAVKFPVNPEPDYIGINPKDLPY